MELDLFSSFDNVSGSISKSEEKGRKKSVKGRINGNEIMTNDVLNKEDVFPRRYFYPSLNKLPYLKEAFSCPISEDISLRIACLPLYVGLTDIEVDKICKIIRNSIDNQYAKAV